MTPKFRAWDKKLSVMAKVISLSFYDEKSVYRNDETESYLFYPSLNSFNLRPFKDIELMQATGLKNCETSDGKKCDGWEGDIAEIGWSDVVGEFHYHKIVLKNQIEYTSDEFWWLINCHYIKILGNIYENPELLEAE